MFASERGIDEMDFSAVQKKVHSLLMERLDLRQMERMEDKLVRQQIRQSLRDLIDDNGFVLNEHEQSVLIENVENEVLGMGPLEPLLRDPSISDILINTADTCYIERHGVLEKVNIRFQNNDHLMRIIQKIARRSGVGWMNPAPWWMLALWMVRESMPLSPRWLWMALCCLFVNLRWIL